MNKPKTINDFWAMVQVSTPDSCWTWKGKTINSGYGAPITLNKIYTMPHRHAFFLYNGHYPSKGKVIMHLCDIKTCCNPHHLRQGTQADNMADMKSKQRQGNHSRPREINGSAKLSPKDIPQIHTLRKKGHQAKYIARKFNVSVHTIYDVFQNKTWK